MDVVIGLPSWLSGLKADWSTELQKIEGVKLDYVGRFNMKTGLTAYYFSVQTPAACVKLGMLVQQLTCYNLIKPIVNEQPA